MAFKSNQNTFFIYGYLKNEMETIDSKEVNALKTYAANLFALTNLQIDKLLAEKNIIEVK